MVEPSYFELHCHPERSACRARGNPRAEAKSKGGTFAHGLKGPSAFGLGMTASSSPTKKPPERAALIEASKSGLLDLGFLEHDVLARHRVVLLERELLGLGARILLGDIEEAGVGAGDHLDQDRGRLGHGLCPYARQGECAGGRKLVAAAGLSSTRGRASAPPPAGSPPARRGRKAHGRAAGGWRPRRHAAGWSRRAGRACAGR